MKNTIMDKPTTGQALSLTGSIFSSIGSAAGTTIADLDTDHLRNGMCSFFGRLFKVIESEVWEWDGSTWTKVVTQAAAGGSVYSGLYPVFVGGEARLMYVAMPAFNTFKEWLFDPVLNTWTGGSTKTYGTNQTQSTKGGLSNTYLIQQKIFCLHGISVNDSYLTIYDPNTDSISQILVDSARNCYCSPIRLWKEFPFFIRVNSGSTAWELIRINGVSLITEATIGDITAITSQLLQETECCIFIDPNTDDLILILLDINSTGSAANMGWKAYKVNGSLGSLSVTEISANVLPTGLRAVSSRPKEQWRAFSDQQDSPGTPVVKLVLQTEGGAGGTSQRYDWVDNATELTEKEPLVASGLSWPDNNAGAGGERIWTNTKISCGIEDTPVGGSGFDTVNVRLSDPAGSTTGHSIQFYWTDPSGEYPDTLAALQNPSAGSISGSTLWTGLNASAAPGTAHSVEVLVPGTVTSDRLRLVAIAQ